MSRTTNRQRVPRKTVEVAAEPTPQARQETVSERLRREAEEEAKAAAARMAAERERIERAEAERRAKAEADRIRRENAAKLEAQRKAAAERAGKVARAHRLRAHHAALVAQAELTYVHLDKMLAAMLAYENDRKTGKADGLGPFEHDFCTAMENLASMKSDYRQMLVNPRDLLTRRLGWRNYNADMTAIAEGERIEAADAAKREAAA